MKTRSKYQARHYEDAAARCLAAAPGADRNLLIETFISMFRPDNPRFDPQRFRDVALGHRKGRPRSS